MASKIETQLRGAYREARRLAGQLDRVASVPGESGVVDAKSLDDVLAKKLTADLARRGVID